MSELTMREAIRLGIEKYPDLEWAKYSYVEGVEDENADYEDKAEFVPGSACLLGVAALACAADFTERTVTKAREDLDKFEDEDITYGDLTDMEDGWNEYSAGVATDILFGKGAHHLAMAIPNFNDEHVTKLRTAEFTAEHGEHPVWVTNDFVGGGYNGAKNAAYEQWNHDLVEFLEATTLTQVMDLAEADAAAHPDLELAEALDLVVCELED